MASNDYLKRMYLDSAPKKIDEYAEVKKKKKKKKKRKVATIAPLGVVLHDEDIDVRPPDSPEATGRPNFEVGFGSDGEEERRREGAARRMDSSEDEVRDLDVARRRLDSSSDGSDSDLPVRKRRRLDSDQEDSSEEEESGEDIRAQARRMKETEENGSSGGAVQVAGKRKTGLISAKEMREEEAERLRLKKEREEAVRKARKEKKPEETIYRDKRGRRLETLESFVRQQDGQKRAKEDEEMVWGTGRVQKQKEADALAAMKKMRNAPFARDINDEGLDAVFRDRDRFEDPMAMFLTKDKKKKKRKRKEGSDDEEEPLERPMYRGRPGPPNRFNIAPGFRWDGVDRSNGWETWLFKNSAAKRAHESESYKWRTQEM